jgi:hypothetical protein
MAWQIDLVGEGADVADIAEITGIPFFDNVVIADGPDGRKCLGGSRFDTCESVEQVCMIAQALLHHLNALARLRYPNHRPVKPGRAIIKLHPDGRRDQTIMLLGAELRMRGSLAMVVTRANGSTETISSANDALDRLERIASNPQLLEVMRPLAEEISWQKLRVAFERITALIGRSWSDSQAIWQKGYASREEIDRFKANTQDPRHSGVEAVHGVPDGPLRGTKMTEQDGLSFIVGLINAYLDHHP